MLRRHREPIHEAIIHHLTVTTVFLLFSATAAARLTSVTLAMNRRELIA